MRPHESCLVYLDMIMIGGTFQEYLLNLRSVPAVLGGAPKLITEKCQLLQKAVQYLSHIVSSEGITTDPKKLKAVREWTTQTNTK
jgi:hypothetical protein